MKVLQIILLTSLALTALGTGASVLAIQNVGSQSVNELVSGQPLNRLSHHSSLQFLNQNYECVLADEPICISRDAHQGH